MRDAKRQNRSDVYSTADPIDHHAIIDAGIGKHIQRHINEHHLPVIVEVGEEIVKDVVAVELPFLAPVVDVVIDDVNEAIEKAE